MDYNSYSRPVKCSANSELSLDLKRCCCCADDDDDDDDDDENDDDGSTSSRFASLGQLMKYGTTKSVVRASSVHNHGFGKASCLSVCLSVLVLTVLLTDLCCNEQRHLRLLEDIELEPFLPLCIVALATGGLDSESVWPFQHDVPKNPTTF